MCNTWLRVLAGPTQPITRTHGVTSQVESSKLLMLLSHGNSRAPAAPCSTASANGTASGNCPVKPLQVHRDEYSQSGYGGFQKAQQHCHWHCPQQQLSEATATS